MKHNKNKKGFTIVELVIVIGVIGILAGILIPTFVNVTKSAEEAALKSNLANAYSSYVADASDNVVDKEHVKEVTGVDYAETKTYTIDFLKQSEVALVKDGKQYGFKNDTWVELGDTEKLTQVQLDNNGYKTVTITVKSDSFKTYVAGKYNQYQVYRLTERVEAA